MDSEHAARERERLERELAQRRADEVRAVAALEDARSASQAAQERECAAEAALEEVRGLIGLLEAALGVAPAPGAPELQHVRPGSRVPRGAA